MLPAHSICNLALTRPVLGPTISRVTTARQAFTATDCTFTLQSTPKQLRGFEPFIKTSPRCASSMHRGEHERERVFFTTTALTEHLSILAENKGYAMYVNIKLYSLR